MYYLSHFQENNCTVYLFCLKLLFSCVQDCTERANYYFDNLAAVENVASKEDCRDQCRALPGCRYFTLTRDRTCNLKRGGAIRYRDEDVYNESGSPYCVYPNSSKAHGTNSHYVIQTVCIPYVM